MQLTKMSLSVISSVEMVSKGNKPPDAKDVVDVLKGPPFAVSAISHLRMFSAGRPAFSRAETAPDPQRPRAPMTMTRGRRPAFLAPSSRAFLTSVIRASSLG